ncbi:MAG: formylglycine-generating enzyme family protein [Blastocatellia bacterium]|nr:formylglycine-generating enzyme family protein [Blastocatellia bacterium]
MPTKGFATPQIQPPKVDVVLRPSAGLVPRAQFPSSTLPQGLPEIQGTALPLGSSSQTQAIPPAPVEIQGVTLREPNTEALRLAELAHQLGSEEKSFFQATTEDLKSPKVDPEITPKTLTAPLLDSQNPTRPQPPVQESGITAGLGGTFPIQGTVPAGFESETGHLTAQRDETASLLPRELTKSIGGPNVAINLPAGGREQTSQIGSPVNIALSPPATTNNLGESEAPRLPQATDYHTAAIPDAPAAPRAATSDPAIDTLQASVQRTVQQQAPRGQRKLSSSAEHKPHKPTQPATPLTPPITPTLKSPFREYESAEEGNQAVQLPAPPPAKNERSGAPQLLAKFLDSPPAPFEPPRSARGPLMKETVQLPQEQVTPLQIQAETRPQPKAGTSDLKPSQARLSEPSAKPAKETPAMLARVPAVEVSTSNSTLIAKLAAMLLVILIIGGGAAWFVYQYVIKPTPTPAPAQPQVVVPQKTPQPTPTPPPVTPPATPADMTAIPGGAYLIGRDSGPQLDTFEKPQHAVKVDPFYLDTFEVTNAQFKKFMDATGHGAPSTWTNGQIPAGQETFPVTGVSLEDAQSYAKWIGKRLPTEIEWEVAAHGNNVQRYPWGDTFEPNRLYAAEKGRVTPTAVGSCPSGAGPFGNQDLSGNVWEWTFSPAEPYPGSSATIPNPNHETLYIVRGGGFDSKPEYCTTTYRNWVSSTTRHETLGFRCAKSKS